ncbi:unnamed protein product [Rotaria sp. Silwood1]|nr:unnamed protein product [Rotaria sp. Silwood1]
MIPDDERRQEIATKLLSLLSELRWTPNRDQEIALYTLVDQDHLTLEHLEVAASFETYISYLTQLVIAHPEDDNQLEEKIQIQLDKLLKEKHFPTVKGSFEQQLITYIQPWTENNAPSEDEPASPDQIQVEIRNMTSEPAKLKCMEILEMAVQILDLFHKQLQHICASRQTNSIQDIIRIFPDIQQAENDINQLQPLLDPAALPQLLSIVSFWKNRSRIHHICKGLSFLSKAVPVSIDSTLFDRVCAMNATTSGEECGLVYEKYRDQIEKPLPDNMLTLFSYYSSASDLFDFLGSLSADDVYNLQEAVNDWEETLVSTNIVFEFATVKNFVDRAYAIMKVKHQKLKNTLLQLNDIAADFTNVWKNEQFTDILKYLESSSLALSSIKRIHLELVDKEQSKRRRIADILQNSIVYFVRIEHNEITFDVNVELPSQQTTTTDEKKQQKIKFADLSELRDRARLLEYSSNVNKRNLPKAESEREKEKLRNFIQFANILESTIEILTSLYTAGHPSVSDFLVNQTSVSEGLVDQKKFSCNDGSYHDLREYNQILINLFKNWKEKLCTMYKTHINLTYFSGNQLWQIEDYIYGRSSVSHPGYHLLKFIGIDPNSIEQPKIKQQTPEDRLENLGRLLFHEQETSAVKEESPKIKKCFLVETTNEGILRAILSLFSLTKTIPSVYRVLYCTQRTNWIQIRAFIYGCFYSQSFHQLIRPELLSQSVQDKFIGLLRTLVEQKPYHLFRMGIITTTTPAEQQMINGLQSMQILNIYRDGELLNKDDFSKTLKQMIRGCHLFISRIAGLGKSSVIRHIAEESTKNYVKFPISGDFDVDILAERLSSKCPQLQKAIIHLDIGSIHDIQQLNEVLYCLLLFRSFRFGQVAVSIPAETSIYIELDASPQSTLNEISLFQHIPSLEHINHVDWNKLNVKSSEIQIVAKYLQAIATEMIIKQDVDLSNLKELNAITLSRLIQDHFLQNKNLDFITWTQLSIFIAVFYRLFTSFSLCSFFFIKWVHRPALRMDIVQTLLRSSNQFTSLSVEAVRKQQRAVANNAPEEFSNAIVRWDTVQPFILIFTDTHEPLFIYKRTQDIPPALVEYFKTYYQATGQRKELAENIMFPDYDKLSHTEFFIKLASLSRKYFNKSVCPKCFRQYEYKDRLCARCLNIDLIRPASFNDSDVTVFQISIAEKLKNEYVLTPDNFVKMLLIYMRVQSGIPVLIMGETGCGKTALIQFLCQKILDDDLEAFRMHAGVDVDKLITTVQSYIKQAQECKTRNKRLWVFFDEFNTTSNVGLLKEIICERTLLGEPLPSNMVFLGACNPRRNKTNKILINEDAQIGLRQTRYEIQKLCAGTDRRLLYTVVPIPETMLEYIWDYGYLNEPTERAYIKTMLNTCRDLSTDPKLLNLTVDLLVNSQKHFRELEDASSVSLRDIARFCRLYNWFLESLSQRSKVGELKKNTQAFLRRATFIALLLCYYFRSRSVKLQQIYIEKMQIIIAQEYPRVKQCPDYLTKIILEYEQKKLIDEMMELPAGTAPNRALRDNIFVLFACIVNRIPLFLCGKPGSSKSSAVQIVISNLKGKKSRDPYFQTLPELVAVSFQGSQNCTSESIVKVFERAENYTRVKSISELLPVIVFDEIGLAELSPHNPLKVLHAELEFENNRYGFVGISNWRLDASKMNRALYLSTPDPDVQDLQLTGKIISDSMQQQSNIQIIQFESIIIEGLSQAYYDLYEILKETQPDHQNYFGLRDYYSLIKGILRDLMLMKHEANWYEIIRRQLKVNFDGVLDGSLLMWQHFCEYIHKQNLFNEYSCPPFNLLLDQTFKARTGRYLMLIGDSQSAIDYVERFINVHQKKLNVGVRTLVGSSFPGDLLSLNTYAEQYNYRVLMDVILYAETNITLIMRQMGHVYDNLYDLFNQNFAVSAKKKYCRIALGALYHPRCLVHDDFYCVVFIHKRDLDKCDPPFLNRFEKHLIDIETLIHPRHKSVANDLHMWLDNLLPKKIGKHFPLIQHLFVDYSQDQICNLVIETYEQLNIHIDAEEANDRRQNAIDHCQVQLLRTSSFDLPLVLSLQKTAENQKLIDQYYDVHRSISFAKLIQQSLENDTNIVLRIIYTYTQIFHPIDKLPNNIEEIKLSTFKTELELTNKIKRHYQALTNIRLLLIRVDYHNEHQHILSLKHVLLNEHVNKSDRGVWLIFHLQRNLLNQITNDVLFSKWPVDMIDDLNNHTFIPKKILDNPSYRDLVLQPQYILTECAFDDLIDRCLSKFRYIVPHKNDERLINTRRERNFQQIIQQKDKSSSKELHLRSIVETNLMTLIQKFEVSENRRFTDWRLDLLTNGKIIAGSRSFYDAFQATISTFHESYLFLLLAHLEQHNFVDAYNFMSSVSDKNIQKYLANMWKVCLETTLENIDLTIIDRDMIEIQLTFDLKLPCAAIEYENIRTIREKLQQLEDNDNESLVSLNFAIDQLKSTSVYGTDFIRLVFTDRHFFELYIHDQIVLHLKETNIHLSPKFVLDLLLSNPSHTIEQNAQLFLAQYIEFTEILRLFEIGLQLVSEEEIRNTIQKQLIEDPTGNIKHSNFYTLVIVNQQFYQLPPQTTTVEDKWAFKCKGNPMIETSLMNLIELILSSPIIDRTNSIQQVTTIYSLIAQSARDLPSYLINNLEKLRSFISLIRCLAALLPDKALDVFKHVCRQGFDAKFDSCQSIHLFITHLQDVIRAERSTADQNVIHRTLVKLEVEFLKDWLADNGDSYGEILNLMNQDDNDLWHYSAKFFTYIDRKLDLLSTLKENNGNLPFNDQYEELDNFLERTKNPNNKIERLMMNRLHMNLMRNAPGHEIDKQLKEHFDHFRQNLHEIQNIEKVYDIKSISMLAWLKYYAQIYGFALNADSGTDILPRIDQLLTNIDTPFCSTLKLFILKQMLQISGLNLNDMRTIYVNRNVIWIKPLLERPRDQQTQNIRRILILPTPLFECQKEFKRVSEILNEVNKTNELRQLIGQCSTSQKFSYAVLCWYIQYYCRFMEPNTKVDDTFVQDIDRNLSQDIIRSFTQLGHRFLVSLCTNFSENSYFRLHPAMPPNEIHQRLIALNIVAFFISLKSLPEITYLGNILFNNQRQMPNNYGEHLSTVCLPGMIISDPAITQMMDVRTQIQDRLNRGVIHAAGKYIFQCSRDCPWMFYFQDCGVPNDRNKCSLCKKPIGAERYNVLIQRDPPQIQMSVDEGLRVINQYIDRYNQKARLGYHNVNTHETSNTGDKPDHLNRPVSFRFIHFLTHGLLLFLHDRNYLTDDDIKQRFKLSKTTHLRDHFEKDYALLVQSSTDSKQCYIWLYKLLEHLINDELVKRGVMNTNERVLQIEQLIEQKIIFAHIDSITTEITEYKKAYAEFIQERDSKPSLESFIDELFEDEKQYPLFNFFNVTAFHTTNPLDAFILKMQTLPYAERSYPVTMFLLKRFEDYANIQYLYPIIVFTNYLIEKLNYRIKRIDAAERKIIHYLTTGNDQHIMKQYYDDFLHAWYSLKLKEVRYGCQTPKFELTAAKEKFAESTSIATLLLNTSKDESSLLLAASIKTIAELQNEIVNYFHNNINDVINIETKRKQIPLQSIRLENILRLDRIELSQKLVDDSLVINYQYGKGKDIIYDYEEIEMTLRNMISSLVLLDTEKLRFLNYQFELYGENTSLINDVRARIKQQQMTNDERTKLQRLLGVMSNDDILNYLGSLDYVFTYLRNSVPEHALETTTIQTFVEYHIHSYACLNDNILRRPPFSTIQLQYIIDLYETIEENAFDKVLRAYVKKELVEETFTDKEREHVLHVFSRMTFEKETIAETLKSIDSWISMLKRLMIRVLNANVSLDVPLQLYLERTDLWSDRVSNLDLDTFQVDDDILLQHTYVILRGLETKQKRNNQLTQQQQQKISEIQSIEGQREKVQTWFDTTARVTTGPKVLKPKIRV